MGRNKKSEDRKKKKLSTTIDPILWDLLEEYCEKNNINKSQFLEKLMKDGLKNTDTLNKLNDDNIILPDSDLLKNK